MTTTEITTNVSDISNISTASRLNRGTSLGSLGAIALSLATTLLAPLTAHAWGDMGHEVVGEIAERLIATRDPQTMNAINSIIGLEPLKIAATWPDHVRDDVRYKDFADYHFYTYFRDPKTTREKDITTVLYKYPSVLIDPSIVNQEQAIALRFIVHMVGDAHQPLHSGNEFDRGANNCTVNFQPNENYQAVRSNLHKVWDTDIIGVMTEQWRRENPAIKYFGAKDIANILIAQYPDLIASELSIEPRDWIKEGMELSKTAGVYPDSLPENQRPYCMKKAGELRPEEIPTLGFNYFLTSRAVIERQLVKGGVRLAAYLKHHLKNRVSPIIDTNQIINDLLKKNDPLAPASN